jgi:hypothetical protein
MGLPSDRRWDTASRARLASVLLCLMALWLINAAAARADTTVNVNTTNGASTMGDGLCSLPEAVTYADGTPEPDCAPGTPTGTTTIKVPADATKYTVPGTLSITKNTTIDGGGASSTTIDGGGAVQVLNIASTAQVTISGVTISGGLSGDSTAGCTGSIFGRSCPQEDGLPGGGIANAGTLTLQDSAVTGNRTSAGVRPFSFIIRFCGIFPNCVGSAGESAGDGGNGGGIYNQGQITIADSTIADNAAGNGGDGTDGQAATGADTSAGEPGGSGGFGGWGGGLYNDSGAAATIADSTIAGNAAGNAGNAGAGGAATISLDSGGSAGFPGFGGSGGGIVNFGILTVTGSTLAANVTGVGGNGANGALGDGAGSGSNSTSGNGGSGGGIYSSSTTTVALSNSTIAGNTASAGGTGGTGPGSAGSGGGIDQAGVGLVALVFVTVDGNQAGAGGGLFHSSVGSVTEAASIIASNTGSPAANCGGPMVTDDGNNLVFGDNSCPGTAGVPKLSPLADNGGPTQTMALQAGSNAVDLVPANACPHDRSARRHPATGNRV